jgi:large subunit ribosomal protein L21
MKKAVILTGNKQYLVSEGQTLDVDKIKVNKDKLEFKPLLVIDGDMVEIGTPELDKNKVTAEIVEEVKLADKVTSIRFKAKKRVKTVHGHRQRLSTIKISKII